MNIYNSWVCCQLFSYNAVLTYMVKQADSCSCLLLQVACSNLKRIILTLMKGEPYNDPQNITGNVHKKFPRLNIFPQAEIKVSVYNDMTRVWRFWLETRDFDSSDTFDEFGQKSKRLETWLGLWHQWLVTSLGLECLDLKKTLSCCWKNKWMHSVMVTRTGLTTPRL